MKTLLIYYPRKLTSVAEKDSKMKNAYQNFPKSLDID